MSLLNFIIILIGVSFNAIAQLLLKAGTSALSTLFPQNQNYLISILKIIFEPHIFCGLSCYVISVGIWIVALSKVEVGIAYPMLSIGYVINAIAAWYLFGESLSLYKILGISIIILGVYLVAKS